MSETRELALAELSTLRSEVLAIRQIQTAIYTAALTILAAIAGDRDRHPQYRGLHPHRPCEPPDGLRGPPTAPISSSDVSAKSSCGVPSAPPVCCVQLMDGAWISSSGHCGC